jgi:predicted outer membrane repeat protein
MVCIRAGALAVLLLATINAGATDFSVTRLDDPVPSGCLPDDCSLREAVIAANALPGADRILLPAGSVQLTITNTGPNPGATQGDLDLTNAVEIVGVSAASSAILALNNDRLFNIIPGVDVTLRKLTLGGGKSGIGGAILQNGGLTIEDAVIGNNTATGDGGAIRNSSTTETVLRRVQLLDNVSGAHGGAIQDGGGGVLIVDSVLSGNNATDGGAIFGHEVRIYRSVFENNKATGNGGAVRTDPNCSCTMLEVHESTFTANSAAKGGALYTAFPFDIELSTISGNSASVSGGGIYLDNTSGNNFLARNLHGSTLYLNTAPTASAILFYDVSVDNSLTPSVQNTIVGGTCAHAGTGSETFDALLGNIESPGHSCGFGLFSLSDVASLNLGALGDNGGPTPTHLPLAGSIAIANGWDIVCDGRDQRGYARNDNQCDSGSVEVGALDDVLFRDGFDF